MVANLSMPRYCANCSFVCEKCGREFYDNGRKDEAIKILKEALEYYAPSFYDDPEFGRMVSHKNDDGRRAEEALDATKGF